MKTIIKMISKHSRKQRKIRKREEEQKKIDNELNIYNIAQETVKRFNHSAKTVQKCIIDNGRDTLNGVSPKNLPIKPRNNSITMFQVNSSMGGYVI